MKTARTSAGSPHTARVTPPSAPPNEALALGHGERDHHFHASGPRSPGDPSPGSKISLTPPPQPFPPPPMPAGAIEKKICSALEPRILSISDWLMNLQYLRR